MHCRISLLFLALILLLWLAPVSNAKTLKIATLAPEGTLWMEEMRKAGKEIETETEGRVKFKFYPGGVMGTDKTVMRKIRAGQLQGAAFTSVSLTDVYIDVQIYGMPFLFRSYDEVDYVRERMDGVIRDGLEKGGMVALGITEGGFAYLLSDEKLRRVDDLKAKKVWVPEGDIISQTTLEVAGISPVILPLADVYTGLQTGLVDTVATTPAAAIALQWHTRVKYFMDLPLMYLVGVLAIDMNAFGKLSPEDQAAVREITDRASARMDRLNRQGNESALGALRKRGIEFVNPAVDEEQEQWHAIAEEALLRLKGKGVYSTEMLETLRGHLETYRSSRAAHGQ